MLSEFECIWIVLQRVFIMKWHIRVSWYMALALMPRHTLHHISHLIRDIRWFTLCPCSLWGPDIMRTLWGPGIMRTLWGHWWGPDIMRTLWRPDIMKTLWEHFEDQTFQGQNIVGTKYFEDKRWAKRWWTNGDIVVCRSSYLVEVPGMGRPVSTSTHQQ